MKRLTSIALSSLLAFTMVGSCITVASAAATDVDFDQTATLTLTKYETGTKETNNPKTIDGATFTAYRVLDLTGDGYSIDSAFQGSGITVADLVDTSGNYVSYGTYGTTTDLEAQITTLQNYVIANNISGKNLTGEGEGKYTLSTSDFGVYLVRETKAPDDCVISTQSFLVAIPQWDQEGNDGKGEWDYTIEAAPKDQTIDVTKEISDHADNNNKVEEDSYEIGDNIPYTVTAPIPNYGTSTDYTDLTVTHNLALNYKDGSGQPDQQTGISMYNNLGLLFTDTLSKGLELNDLGNTSGLGLTVTVGTTELTTGKAITANNIKEITNTTLTDEQKIYAALQAAGMKLTGATYENGTYAGTTDSGAQFVYYSVKDDTTGKTTMYVYVPWCVVDNQNDADNLGNQGNNIVLTYSAYLTADAVQGTGYDNNVTYNYTNDPQTVSADAYDPKSSDDDETTTYTYGMVLTKQLNGSTTYASTEDITNVTFELYAGSDTSGSAIKFIKNDDGSYTLVDDDNAATLGAEVTSLTLTSDGKLIIKGLAAGTYQLKETKTVDGYSLLTDPVTIVVTEGTNDNGVVNGTVKATINDGNNVIQTLKTKAEAESTTTDADKATFVLTVNNSEEQFNLPLTGGLGLWIFTIAGGVIMAAAIIVFAVSRKKKASK